MSSSKPVRVEIHSPPKESIMSRFDNGNFTIFISIVAFCIFTSATILGGIYLAYHR